jgi:hypothetical protein
MPVADQEFRERFLVGLDDRGRTVALDLTLRATVE